MATTTRTATKALAAQEDLLFGEGTAEQTRAGESYTVNKIRGFYPVNSTAELNALDFLKFPKAALVENGQLAFYQHNGVEYERVQLLPKGEVITAAITTTPVVGVETLVIDASTPHTVTDFTNGVEYQRLYVIARTANTTIQHNSVIKLKGGVDLNIPVFTGITLIYNGSVWSEV